jgi:hypothetical protein
VGRLVEGSLYKGNSQDAEGKELIFKKGKNAGQPRTVFYIGVAFPKGNETHWNQTEWGQKIEEVAKASFPGGQWRRPDFAWKITDGDSTILNKANRRPCDKEGFAGNWILKFSGSFAPKVYDRTGTREIVEENFVNLGDYVQVLAEVAGNNSDQQPGVYLNQVYVSFSGYGERIVLGPDPRAAGFGQAPLPPGASATPREGTLPPIVDATVTPHSMHVTPAAAPAPYPQILNAPPAPPAPPAAPLVYTMLPAAGGRSYQEFIAAGWTREQMIENGIILP